MRRRWSVKYVCMSNEEQTSASEIFEEISSLSVEWLIVELIYFIYFIVDWVIDCLSIYWLIDWSIDRPIVWLSDLVIRSSFICLLSDCFICWFIDWLIDWFIEALQLNFFDYFRTWTMLNHLVCGKKCQTNFRGQRRNLNERESMWYL